ncbi:conserved Plasmodium protein, unknown function [Plasmodium knowlesi strain H]|uniref:SURP motif domain-containing protein n=3 Tax=Plasmodium knowlesi TaxID=5850 RepID=A0A5K1V9U9_PLAKH|nr:conserved Plasmodium protein, unknown function [Plasmodium knowlesi strain H]OTN64383.1 Uncharacterized protein PKNOH_S130192500 [Plasmodium knowlesi]CAA9989088.1 conserved Plasmodium protein, unknown function [Plasmodium knowlesi strain H]SBO27302.1 conserved Plasmodium protein, unknown function [Plasmodium knowlesi strain H]SBO28928.1 conserved Plasmodium protein, unknown function [Plasmodium knowlesi strain H]VVS78562.1 conserved Plasmodium protein, unknown function [Plasmodium knowlesi |eukprot:XP_002261435.1 hypothetical protein, conserved in Plasmodium species [Plasmodium knowlesi strain H]
MKKRRYFTSEPPPDHLNYVNTKDTSSENCNDCLDQNEQDIFASYLPRVNQNIYFPKSLREHMIIEYTAMFANSEGDIAEFYLKLNNDVLINFPFLHVDHPLHGYYELVKENTKRRLIDDHPNSIPTVLHRLFRHVRKLEKDKVTSNEVKDNMLREKQKINIKDANDMKAKLSEREKRKKKEREDQSYSSLFMKYMESDDETDVKEIEKEKPIGTEDLLEMDNLINQIVHSKKELPIYFARLLMRCIEKLKYLQYGSKEYAYFSERIMPDENFHNGAFPNLTSADFLSLLFLLDEKNLDRDKAPEGDTKEEPVAEGKDKIKTIQECRRERAKMILQEFKKE